MSDAVEDLVHDHADINRLVLETSRALYSGDHDALEDRLLQLQEQLFRHFAREEEGLFPFASDAAPQFAADMEALLAAHDTICGIVARMASLLETDDTPWDKITALFGRFETTYAAHAAGEAELLERLGSALTGDQRAKLAQVLEGI